MEEDFIHRHHVEPRVQLHGPKEETFPNPLKYIDVTRTAHTELDVVARKSRIDDYCACRCGSKFVRLMERIHEVHISEWKTSKRKNVVRGTAYKHSSNYQTWLFVVWNVAWHVKSSSEEGNASMGYRKTQSSIMQEGWEASICGQTISGQKYGPACHQWPEIWTSMNGRLKSPQVDNARRLRGIYFIDPEDGEYKATIKKTRRQSWRFLWRRRCVAKWEQRSTLGFRKLKRRVGESNKIPRQSMYASWRLKGPRESVWNLLHQKIMNITLQVKDTFRWHIFNWYTHLSQCLKRCKFRMRKQQWTRNGRSSKRFQVCSWTT